MLKKNKTSSWYLDTIDIYISISMIHIYIWHWYHWIMIYIYTHNMGFIMIQDPYYVTCQVPDGVLGVLVRSAKDFPSVKRSRENMLPKRSTETVLLVEDKTRYDEIYGCCLQMIYDDFMVIYIMFIFYQQLFCWNTSPLIQFTWAWPQGVESLWLLVHEVWDKLDTSW